MGSKEPDPWQLVHAAVERGGELAAQVAMLGGDQAVREAARTLLEQRERAPDRLAVLERKGRFVQEAANGNQVGGLVLVERRPQRPYRFGQDEPQSCKNELLLHIYTNPV